MLKRTLGVPLFQEQLLRMAMIVANFTGAQAEELRRAVGMRRSWERMKNLEGKLREAMTANGLDTATEETSSKTSVRLLFMFSGVTRSQLRSDRVCIGVHFLRKGNYDLARASLGF